MSCSCTQDSQCCKSKDRKVWSEAELDLDFVGFPKIPRLRRDMIITEKIDGTNASVIITEDGRIFFGSKNRFITTKDDNYGFAKWGESHRDELMELGKGHHFGEWWGSGIQRGYGLPKGEKRFSLFNTKRWCLHDQEPLFIPTQDPKVTRLQKRLPACCGLVPVLYEGSFDIEVVDNELEQLRLVGSSAAPGFFDPEGVVVFHTAAGAYFKQTMGNDGRKGG
jgi:hypothetical protein